MVMATFTGRRQLVDAEYGAAATRCLPYPPYY